MGASPFPYCGIRNSLEHVSGFATKSRGVAYTGYNITSDGEEGDESEKRESFLFHQYYQLSLSICRCDLEPRSNRMLYMFPSNIYIYIYTYTKTMCIHIIMYVCIYIYVYIYIYVLSGPRDLRALRRRHFLERVGDPRDALVRDPGNMCYVMLCYVMLCYVML